MNLFWIHCGFNADEPFEYGSQLVYSTKSADELKEALRVPMLDMHHPDRAKFTELFPNLDMSNPYIPLDKKLLPDDSTGVYSIQEIKPPSY